MISYPTYRQTDPRMILAANKSGQRRQDNVLERDFRESGAFLYRYCGDYVQRIIVNGSL
jgi:hypothetical protein